MTSKISCFKLLKEDLKSRSWLIILLFFACAVLLPVIIRCSSNGLSGCRPAGLTRRCSQRL